MTTTTKTTKTQWIPLTASSGTRPLRPRLEPTPPEKRTPLRPTTWWRAYLTIIVAYLLVFGDSLLPIIEAGGAMHRAAPEWRELWPAALLHWGEFVFVAMLAVGILACVAWDRSSSHTYVRIRDLGITPPWTRTQDPAQQTRWRIQATLVFTLALTTYMLAAIVNGLLALAFPDAAGGFVNDSADAALRMLVFTGPGVVLTAVIEETIVVGVVVTMLAAARRPTAEILAVAALAKIGYHLYYGWPVVFALGPAAVVVAWLYLYTGRLTPIIAAHATHNLAVMAPLLAEA